MIVKREVKRVVVTMVVRMVRSGEVSRELVHRDLLREQQEGHRMVRMVPMASMVMLRMTTMKKKMQRVKKNLKRTRHPSLRLRRTQASRSQRTQDTAVDSQLSNLSIASSMPSSQLPPTQTDSQSKSQLSQTRLTQFRSILGQLTRTNLFQNDMAKMEDVMNAVNARVAEVDEDAAEFEEDEVREALAWMGEKNEIMWLEESGEVYNAVSMKYGETVVDEE